MISGDVAPYAFQQFDGWPPDGEPGFFFGADAQQWPSILWWRHDDYFTGWVGVGIQQDDVRGTIPLAFNRAPETEHLVVKWARAPLVFDGKIG